MLPNIAKKSVEKRKNPTPNPNPNPNPNLNQQPEEIAIRNFENVFQRNVKGKRTLGNVQTGLQTNAKKRLKPVGRRKNPNRKNPKEGSK